MAERRVSAAALRARQMLVGGLVLGHAVGLLVIGAAAVIDGRYAAISAALGFATVVIFFAIGQAIEVVACELDPVAGMGLALASYAVRVVGISAGMWFILGHPAVEPVVSRGWLLLSVTVTVMAWLSGVVLVASRQRVPIYDVEYVVPTDVSQSD